MRGQAVTRISDMQVLREIFFKDPDFEVRRKALDNMDDADVLQGLLEEVGDAYMQRKIRFRIEELRGLV